MSETPDQRHARRPMYWRSEHEPSIIEVMDGNNSIFALLAYRDLLEVLDYHDFYDENTVAVAEAIAHAVEECPEAWGAIISNMDRCLGDARRKREQERLPY